MAIALDVIVIAIIAAFGWQGARRGIFKATISLCITLIAAIVAFLASAPVAESVYDSNVRVGIVNALQNSLRGVDAIPVIRNSINEQFNLGITDEDIGRIAKSDDVKSELQSIAAEHGEYISFNELDEKWDELVSAETLTELVGDSVPQEVVESVSDTLQGNDDAITTVIKVACSEDSESAAEEVEKSIFREKLIGIIRALVGVALFAAVAAALRVIYFVLSLAKVIPPVKKLLKAAGLMIGIAEGVFLFFMLGTCLRGLMDNSYGLLETIAQDTIDKTFIFKLFIR